VQEFDLGTRRILHHCFLKRTVILEEVCKFSQLTLYMFGILVQTLSFLWSIGDDGEAVCKQLVARALWNRKHKEMDCCESLFCIFFRAPGTACFMSMYVPTLLRSGIECAKFLTSVVPV
jgi:hypothetical protein